MSSRRFQILLALLLLLLAGLTISCADGDDDDDDSGSNDPGDDDDDDDDDDDNDTSPAPEPFLQVGAARTDITPTWSVKLGGYGAYFFSENTCRWSEGVHDPLQASALVLDDGLSDPVFIINLDVVGIVITDTLVIQQRIADRLGVDGARVIIASTHSHGAPDTIGIWGVMLPPISGRDDDFIGIMIDGAVEAGVAAYDDRRPAVADIGAGQEPTLHFNDQAHLDPNAGLDSTVTVVRFTEPGGAALATLTSWGCHATVMSNENYLITADYPGAFVRHMDEALGGVNVFVNGNLGGGVMPYNRSSGGTWGTWEELDEFGETLAATTQDILTTAEPIDDVRLSYDMIRITTTVRNPLFALLGQMNLIPRPMPLLGQEGYTVVAALQFGPLFFASLPGEVAPSVGNALRAQLDAPYQIHANIAQDWIGYVLSEREYRSLVYAYYMILSPGPGTAKSIGDGLLEIETAFAVERAAD
jgi:Neutral/alkaline non-lysosomal ceramidase, N-terminal